MMSARKTGSKRAAKSEAGPGINPESAPEMVYPMAAPRRARVADSELADADPAAYWPGHYGDVAEEHGSGNVRRKNLNIDQGLLDQARRALGVRTETEAVELGLSAAIEAAEFQQAMLAGFDRLMAIGGLKHDPDDALDFSAFGGALPAR